MGIFTYLLTEGMKSTLEQLSAGERKALALFYDTDAFKALRKLVDVERLELAKDHVDQTDIMQVRYLSGQASSLKKLILTLGENHKQSEKKG